MLLYIVRSLLNHYFLIFFCWRLFHFLFFHSFSRSRSFYLSFFTNTTRFAAPFIKYKPIFPVNAIENRLDIQTDLVSNFLKATVRLYLIKAFRIDCHRLSRVKISFFFLSFTVYFDRADCMSRFFSRFLFVSFVKIIKLLEKKFSDKKGKVQQLSKSSSVQRKNNVRSVCRKDFSELYPLTWLNCEFLNNLNFQCFFLQLNCIFYVKFSTDQPA